MSVGVEASGSTSHTLLQRVQQQEPDAWRRFASLYAPVVLRWCSTNGLQSHDAADVTQEVFHAVFQGIARFQRNTSGQSLRGWLWTITRNKICDHFRRRQSEPLAVGGTALFDPEISISEADPEPGDRLTAELTHRVLLLMQSDFETTTWQAFWAMAVDGLSAKAAGEKLGMTPAAVYTAKSRVLNRLRHELDGLLE